MRTDFRVLACVSGLLVSLPLAGCGAAVKNAAPLAHHTTTAAPKPPKTPALPAPHARYTVDCSYVLGDFTASAHGYRFLADTTIRNTGNVGQLVRITASWPQAGGRPLTQTKTIRLPYGRAKQVHFLRIGTQDEIDLTQAASTSACDVKAVSVDTFGPVHG